MSTTYITKEWQEITLGEISHILKKTTSPLAHPEQKYEVFSIPGFDNGKQPENLKGSEIKSQKFLLNEKCILFSKLNPRIPRVWKVILPAQNKVASTEFLPIKHNDDKVDFDFLYFLLQNPDFTKKIKRVASGTSSSHQRIRPEQLLGEKISLPTISEQRSISSILSAIENKFDLLHRKIQTLKSIEQTIFIDWFISKPQPEWESGTLSEILERLNERIGSAKQEEYTVLSAVKTGELVPSSEYFTKQVFSKSIAKYIKVSSGDFAYNPARINIGSIGRLKEKMLGAVSPVYVVFRAKQGFEDYVEFLITTGQIKSHIARFANGSVRQTLDFEAFGRFPLCLPDSRTLSRFENFHINVSKSIKAAEKQIKTLAEIKRSLITKLMTGEIRI